MESLSLIKAWGLQEIELLNDLRDNWPFLEPTVLSSFALSGGLATEKQEEIFILMNYRN